MTVPKSNAQSRESYRLAELSQPFNVSLSVLGASNSNWAFGRSPLIFFGVNCGDVAAYERGAVSHSSECGGGNMESRERNSVTP